MERWQHGGDFCASLSLGLTPIPEDWRENPLRAGFPLNCPKCGAEMYIITFSTEAVELGRVLEHIADPSAPRRTAPPQGPPERYQDGADGVFRGDEEAMQGDPLAQPAPEYEQLDRRGSW